MSDPTPEAFPEDEFEIDLSEVDPHFEPEPIEWDEIDLEASEPPIAPFVEGRTTWAEVDMEALLRGDLDEPEPVWLARIDDARLLYAAKVSSIAGEPESGKGWFALAAALHVMAEGSHVLYLDFEDSPKGVAGRLVALGVPRPVIATQFHYVRPGQRLITKPNAAESNATWLELLATLKRTTDAQGGLGLIVFDGITEALAMQEIESKDNDTVADWFGNVPRRLAHITGAAVLLIDHVTKSRDERGRYAIGAGAKLAAIDGAQFTTEMKLVAARGRSGLVRINVTKDRPGHVRAIAVGNAHTQAVADMVITARDDGKLRLSLTEPDLKVNADGSAAPTNVQDAMMKYMQKCKYNKGRQEILDAVKGRTDVKRRAFNELIEMDAIVEYKDGRKTKFKIAQPKETNDASAD